MKRLPLLLCAALSGALLFSPPVLIAAADTVSGDPITAIGARPASAAVTPATPTADQAISLVTEAAQAVEGGEWSSVAVMALALLPFGLSFLTHKYASKPWLQSPYTHVVIQAAVSASAGCLTAALSGHFDAHHVLLTSMKCFAGSIAGYVLKQSQPTAQADPAALTGKA